MNSTLSKNPYECLKLDELCETEPIPAQSSWTITDDKAESVSILASVLDNGLWCYGYSVFWKNGRHSYCNPDPAKGLFHSQREAQLYALGFMSLYSSYFTEETNIALLKAVGEKSQGELF